MLFVKNIILQKIRYLFFLIQILKLIENKIVPIKTIYLKDGRERLVKLKNGRKFFVSDLSDIYILWEIYVKKDDKVFIWKHIKKY